MAGVATYLNLPGTTEAAFEFYRAVFGTDYVGEIARYGDVPPSAGETTPEGVADKIMNIGLPILGGHLLMGTDVVDGMGPGYAAGNDMHIMLMPDDKAQADELYARLSDGGTDLVPMADMFWGDYYGSCTDRFGVRWMLDLPSHPTG